MRRWLLLSLLCLTASAVAQNCPKDVALPSSPPTFATLHGQLVYHVGLRQWFELKLDTPHCGQSAIQLIRINHPWTPLQTARGCHVTTTGELGIAGTGYYSLALYQVVTKVIPAPGCLRKPPLPDFTHLQPNPHLQTYRVTMSFDYGPDDHPVAFHVTSHGRPLAPWQAYASYDLTGGYVLYASCGKGFVVDQVFGDPEARPGHHDNPRTPADMAAYDPESAAAAGIHHLNLGYTCLRAQK